MKLRYEHKVARTTLTAWTVAAIDAKLAREENYDVVLTELGKSAWKEQQR